MGWFSSFFSPVVNLVEDVGGGIADLGQGAIDVVSNVGSQIDDTVNQIPGGWGTVAAATGIYFSPEIGAYMNSATGEVVSQEAALAAANDVAAQQAAAASMAGADAGIAGLTFADDIAAQQAAAASMAGADAGIAASTLADDVAAQQAAANAIVPVDAGAGVADLANTTAGAGMVPAAGGIGLADILKYAGLAGLAGLIPGLLNPQQQQAPQQAPQTPVGAGLSPDYKPYRYMPYAAGGITALAGGGYHLGDYSDGGRLLKGPGDGVSDDIPASIGGKQPARLADGEFVIPARIVSEIGNGSTDAGARKLYEMMDRVQSARRKTMGKKQFAKDTKADKYFPA